MTEPARNPWGLRPERTGVSVQRWGGRHDGDRYGVDLATTDRPQRWQAGTGLHRYRGATLMAPDEVSR